MKKLDKLIIKTFIGPFIVVFFVVLFVLMMQFLWKYIDDLVGKGLDISIIAELLVYMSATMVPLALPLAVLLSAIMTFGNLGESYELVALKSAGISLMRFMRPLIVVSAIICLLAFLFSNYVIPVANLQAKSLLYDVSKTKPAFNIKEGIFYDEIDGYTIRVSKKDPDGRTIHNVLIYDRTGGTSNTKLILAKNGNMALSENKKFLYFILHNGWRYEERTDRTGTMNEFIRLGFKEYRKVFDLSSLSFGRTDKELFKSNYQMLNVRQLDKAIDSISRQMKGYQKSVRSYVTSRFGFTRWKDSSDVIAPPLKTRDFAASLPDSSLRFVYDKVESVLRDCNNSLDMTTRDYEERERDIRDHIVEWHRKFTLSFACMVLFLIGAPLGSIIRKGGLGTPLVFAVAFFVIFHVTSFIGEKMARNSVVLPVTGMWMSTVLLLPIAGFLIYKALNDSQLFNKEFYFRLLTRLQKIIRKQRGLS